MTDLSHIILILNLLMRQNHALSQVGHIDSHEAQNLL